jgi:hypothetical protein
MTGAAPAIDREAIALDEFLAYWERLRAAEARTLREENRVMRAELERWTPVAIADGGYS